jgi:Flp pilus assembly pilin Flp
MKSVMKKLVRDEKGAALILALILLLIGGLISAALLGHMGAGILAGTVHERRTAELYAADAGIEDAIWKIKNEEITVCPASPEKSCYPITDINGKNVTVCIEYDVGAGMYKITSVAMTDGEGGGGVAAIDSSTAVEAYVSFSYMDLSSLLDHAIVSYDTIDLQPGNLVIGDVWLPDENNLEIHDPADITGDVKDSNNMTLTWPTDDQLSAYYYEDVEDTYDPGLFIDVKYTKTIGPCYRDGDMVVDNTGESDTLILDGTVYVRDDVQFSQAGSHGYTINLNGNTIFAGGSIDFPSNAVTISGSGCIIAVGNVNFQPAIASAEDDFVLVMSITGRTDFHPSGDFTGCVAGNTEVQLQPGCTINWINPEGKNLNFPGMEGGENPPPINVMKIESWEIMQQ